MILKRILSRLLVRSIENKGSILIALLVLVAGIAYTGYQHGQFHGQLRDCADTFMAAFDGPNEEAARAAFQCSTGVAARKWGGTEAAAVEMNKRFSPESPMKRVGQSDKFHDGTYYVFFTNEDGKGHGFFVLTIGPDGKVVDGQ